MYAIGTNGGTLALQKQAPTSAQADKFIDERLAAPLNVDANNYLYAWESSRDYDPAPGLEKIEAAVLAINAADDERNPPETGITEAALKRVKNVAAAAHPGERGDARPRHHGVREVLCEGAGRVPAEGAAAGDVARCHSGTREARAGIHNHRNARFERPAVAIDTGLPALRPAPG